MLIKSVDEKTADIEILQALLNHPKATSYIQGQKTIGTMDSGITGRRIGLMGLTSITSLERATSSFMNWVGK